MGFRDNIEPDYLKLSPEEKRKIKSKLLIMPILTIVFLCVMLIGEINPGHSWISFTKCGYFFKANYIANNFIQGDLDDVVSHNMLYYDVDDINYSLFGGVEDIKKVALSSLQTAYDTTLKNENAWALMVGLNYKQGGNFSAYANEDAKNGVWHSIGYVNLDSGDSLKIEIRFLSKNIYNLSVEPCFSAESEETEDAEYQEYLNSVEYKVWNNASKTLNWMNMILSNQNDFMKNVGRVFNNKSLTPTMLEKYITKLFTNTRYNPDWGVEEDLQYQSDLAWMLCSIQQEVCVENSTFSVGQYEPLVHGTIGNLVLRLNDGVGNKAMLSIPLLYTIDGYQIIPDFIQYNYDMLFKSYRVEEFIEFTKTGIMPEDIVLERAAAQRILDSKIYSDS